MSNLRVDNIAALGGSHSSTPQQIVQGRAKCWFNLNGTGTIAERDSFNVSSFVDNGTGDYTANFTTALANANYCSTLGYQMAADNAHHNPSVGPALARRSVYPQTTSDIRLQSSNSGTAQDIPTLNFMAHGD